MKIIRQINVEDDDDDDDDISPPPPPPGSPPPPPVYPAAYPAGYPPSGYVYPQPTAYAGKCIEFLKKYRMFHFSCVVLSTDCVSLLPELTFYKMTENFSAEFRNIL